jgi:long-chain acyl-CoA synthetase
MAESTHEELARRVEGQTVTRWLRDAARDLPDQVALRAKNADGSWRELSYADYGRQAASVAAAFRRLGVGAGDRVLLYVRNRPEFHLADAGALLLRATPLSIYNSSSPEQIGYLAAHSEAKVAVVDDLGFLERLLTVRGELPGLQAIVVCDDPESRRPADVLLFDDLLADDPVDLDAAVDAAKPDDLVTVIYTSGTTGNPKGVMLDHSNLAWAVAGYADRIGEVAPGMKALSYLPMAHIAERMVTHYGAVWLGATVSCVPDQATLGAFLAEVHPNSLFGPPRVWEKLRAGILAAVASQGAEKEAGFAQALAVGGQVAQLRRAGAELPEPLAQAHAMVEQAAFAPLRQRVGLDQMIYAFSGAAPLPADVAAFYQAIGVNFSEVYGMSENSGGMTWSPYEGRPGYVGKPWPGTEVVLADDGEVLCRGGIVSRGYLNDPQRTAETFDADGWLHTGDIGEFDADGQLRIVDRKKELIITAGGKNLSPANVEARLKSLPLVGQAAVIGDNRPYVVALLVLDPDVAPAWAAGQGLAATALPDLAKDPAVLAEIERGVAEVNEHFNNVEQVKRFAVLGDEWQPDSEQLTATMKLKRRGVLAAYHDLIESLYA